MTRQEYMKLMEYRLDALDPETRSDFLKELSSHIDDLMAAHPGESEEDSILRLDSPEFVAEAILSECVPASGSAGHVADAAAEFDAAEKSREENPAGAGSRHHREREERGQDRRRFRIRANFDLGEFLASRMRGEKYRDSAAMDFFSRDMEASEVDSIVVRAISADVDILSSAGDIRVEAYGMTDEGHFSLKSEGRTLVLEEKKRLQGLDRIALRVPARIGTLKLRTASGDIAVRGIDASLGCQTASGDVEARDCTDADILTVSGDVSVSDMAGAVMIATTSGDIVVQNAISDVSVSTASGDIRVGECGGALRAESTSGNVAIEAKSAFGGAAVSTVSGDMECILGSGIGASLRASTVSGDIRIEVEGRKVKARQLLIGDGSARLSLSSVSGDLSVMAG